MNFVENQKSTLWSASERNTPINNVRDRLVSKRALLDYKKGLFGQVAILKFFQRGDPMKIIQN